MGNYTTDNTISLIDGVNIRSLHCFIEKANGFLDDPEPKTPYKYSWPDEHGIDIDTQNTYYNERKCSLDLIVNGTDFADVVKNKNAIIDLFKQPLNRYLKLYGIDGVFLVSVSGQINVTRLGRGLSGRQLLRLSIPLIEASPVKYQYYANQLNVRDTVGLDVTTTKSITVDWGDNRFSYILLPLTGIMEHDYTEFGEYCVTIYGGVDGITNVETENLEDINSIDGGVVTPPSGNVTVDSTTVTIDDTTITADQQ